MILHGLGYRRFKIVDQTAHNDPWPISELDRRPRVAVFGAVSLNRVFEAGSSGPFPEPALGRGTTSRASRISGSRGSNGRGPLEQMGMVRLPCGPLRVVSARLRQNAPVPRITGAIVSARIRTSRPTERFSTYSRSTESRSSNVELPAPVDLHRAGDSRLDREPEHVRGLVAVDELDLLGARADEAHVAEQHVDELRQLVEARPAQQPADARHARVVVELEHRLAELVEGHERRQQILGVRHHRPELEHPEGAAALPRPRLREDDRAAAVEHDRRARSARRAARGRAEHGSETTTSIARLRKSVDRGIVPGVVLDDRQIGDVAELNRRAEHAARRRDDAQLDLPAAADRDELRDQRLVDRRRRDDDAVDAVEAVGRVAQVVDRELVALGDDADVDVGEELDLSPGGERQRPVADDQRALRRRDLPPDEARDRRAARMRRRSRRATRARRWRARDRRPA